MANEAKTKSKTNWGLYAILGLIAGVIGCVIYKHYGSSIMPAPSTAADKSSTSIATETKNAVGTITKVGIGKTCRCWRRLADGTYSAINYPCGSVPPHGCDSAIIKTLNYLEQKNAIGKTKLTAAEASWYCQKNPNAPGCDKVGAISWNCKNNPNAPGCDKVKQKGAVVMNRSTSWAS